MPSFTSGEVRVLSEIAHTLYTDPHSPECWTRVFQLLSEVLPAETGAVFAAAPTVGEVQVAHTYGISAQFCSAYTSYYHSKDIVARQAMARGILTGRPIDVISRSEWLNSEIRNDFIIPCGAHDTLSAGVVSGPGAGTTIHVLRTDGAEFDEKHVQTLSCLQPHITNAFAKAAAAEHEAMLMAGYDQIPRPILMFDHHGRLFYMNDMARSFYGGSDPNRIETLRTIEGEVAAIYAEQEDPIVRLRPVRDITYTHREKDYRLSVFIVRPAGAPRYCMACGVETVDHLALLIERCAQARGLSPREAQICRMVVRGASNREIAEELFISEFTVKDHLKNIFGKLGVSSRSKAAAALLSPGM